MSYNRVLLKLSGEALMGDKKSGIDSKKLLHYANEIKKIHDIGVQVAIVLGGGNTAMDCCRTSIRLGADDVKVTVRSPFDQMKASEWEIEDAMNEDIPIHDNEWLGFRPSALDSLPVIGQSKKNPYIYYCFGHQHLGWSLGGITGKIIAQDVCTNKTDIDLEPFSIGRF